MRVVGHDWHVSPAVDESRVAANRLMGGGMTWCSGLGGAVAGNLRRLQRALRSPDSTFALCDDAFIPRADRHGQRHAAHSEMPRPGPRNRLYITWLSGILLVTLLVTSVYASTNETATEETSRRISTCGYVVAFGLNDTVLTTAAKRVIDDAALEASQNGDNSVSLIGTWDTREAEALMRRRMDVIANEISRVKLGDTPITRIEPGPDTLPGGSRIGISVCKPGGEARHRPPPSPDQRIIIALGKVQLAVPLGDLGPAFWADIPFEPLKLPTLELHLKWSEPPSHFVGDFNGCFNGTAPICDRRVDIFIYRPMDEHDDLTHPLHTPRSDLRRIPGQRYGLRFFSDKGLGLGDAPVEADTKQGESIAGECSWKPDHPGTQFKSLKQVFEGHGMPGPDCVFRDFPIGHGMHATFGLRGQLLPEWAEIYHAIIRLIDSFRTNVLPTGNSPTNRETPP